MKVIKIHKLVLRLNIAFTAFAILCVSCMYSVASAASSTPVDSCQDMATQLTKYLERNILPIIKLKARMQNDKALSDIDGILSDYRGKLKKCADKYQFSDDGVKRPDYMLASSGVKILMFELQGLYDAQKKGFDRFVNQSALLELYADIQNDLKVQQ